MESLQDLSQALYDPNLKLYILHRELFYKGREMKLSNSSFVMSKFMQEIKAGKFQGSAVKTETPSKFNLNQKHLEDKEMADEASNKRDSLSRFNFDENPKEAQDAFMRTVINPEKNDNIKKTRWVADGFVSMAKENLPIP